MIPRFARAVVCGALMIAALAPPATAQLTANLGALSGDNAKGYLGPLPKALSGTLNSSIFQTGRVPKTGIGFSIGARAMGITFDTESQVYTPTSPTGFTALDPDMEVPTLIGNRESVAQAGQGGTTLHHPGGFEIENFALAVPQLEIGSIAGTRAIVRWISVEVGDSDLGKIDLFGIGGQHSISQYLPPGFPVDIAAGVFYQKFSIDTDLIESKSLAFNVTASKRFMLFEPYVGVGFDKLDMTAKYESTTDPDQRIEVDFDSETNAHFTAGVQALLAFVKLHAEANIAAENGVAVGLSFGR